MANILEAQDICKNFDIDHGSLQPVLNKINFSIRRGEMVALMGQSGSGKSTLLNCISGMDRLCSGSVVFDDIEISSYSEKNKAKLRLEKMGFIFQQIYLLKNFSVIDNICLPALFSNKLDRLTIVTKAYDLMKMVGISDLANKNITQVSGGQMQRTAICRALINEPDIIFGDEPTGALNSKLTNEVMDLLSKINSSGVTILLATHDLAVAAKTSRVIYIHDGRIISEITLAKLSPNQSNTGNQYKLSCWLDQLS